MQTIGVNCNHCGAPLQVRSATQFVTCAHCGSQLEVKRGEGTIYTQEIEEIRERTEELAEQLQSLVLKDALAELELEWQREREPFMRTDQSGNPYEPNRQQVMTNLAAWLIVGSLVFLIVLGAVMKSPMARASGEAVVCPSLILMVVVIGAFFILSSFRTVERYEHAKARYEARRAELLQSRGDEPD